MSPDAVDTVARTVWGEARGEPRMGKIAVAWVIRNRAARPGWWGTGIISVCRKPSQFSCWNRGDPNERKVAEITLDKPSFLNAYALAAGVLAGHYPDPTYGSTHYLNTALADPDWDDGMTVTARIGRHTFFKET